MVREDLVASAVNFLQDPSVAISPLEKRIAFLQSKNLTQEEVDLALARAGEDAVPPSATAPPPSTANYPYPNQQVVRQQAPPPGGPYGGYPGYWQQQPPPPELPQRDWRDWFIMATVMSGVSYGLYFVAKRYIYPLVAPPTPPQLEQDKAAIDESFTRTFDLLDRLSTDTEALKASEQARTDRLDTSLTDIESVVADLKHAGRRREDENRRLGDDVQALKSLIPKALEAQKETSDLRLRELQTELRSLKTLVGNRMGGVAAPASSSSSSSTPRLSGANMFGPMGTASVVNGNGSGSGSGSGSNTPAINHVPNGSTTTGFQDSQHSQQQQQQQQQASASSAAAPPARSQTSTPSLTAARASIPAWQMAAAAKANNKSSSATNNNVNGADGEAQSGTTAAAAPSTGE
ncbi:MAG: hypothetical protein M1819_003932 [Sarea resinae]|nr:MAG: hypothetical protein M1819_003932 [Sarea resinae]